MLFASVDYLLFLPLVVLTYWAVPLRARLWVMGLSSILFYGSWSWTYLPLLCAVLLAAWGGGLWLASLTRAGRPRGWPRAFVIGGLLVPLLVFKYWDWLSSDLSAALQALGLPLTLPAVDLPLPIGISFYTFQAIAYVVDCGRDGKAEPNPGIFGTFLGWFPHLVAGPIVRRDQLLPTFHALPLLARGDVGQGLYRIGKGLLKKVVFADVVRVGIVDPLFSDPGRFTGLELLLGLYAYTLQIYCDFSAYTDITLGSARLFGIELPENFRRPYKVANITAFWRRWHMTLSLWVRHFIYFPMGGAQQGSARTYLNLMVTFLVLGVWHGASWNFVIYGLIHGVAMCVNRFFRKRHGRDPEAPLPPLSFAWRFLLTFHFIVLARVLFRAPDLPTAWGYAQGLAHLDLVLPRFAPLSWVMLATGFAVHFSPDGWQRWIERRFRESGPFGWALGCALVAAACAFLGTGEQLAFVYYQF